MFELLNKAIDNVGMTTTLEDILAIDPSLERGSIVEELRRYHRKKYGVFYLGRRGQPTRMVWIKRPDSVPETDAEETELISHSIGLSPGRNIIITLPSDIDDSERERALKIINIIL